MRWNIIVECVGEDGKQYAITVGKIERLAGKTTAESLGVNLQESKQIVNRLQETVVKQQLEEHCEHRRKCPTCGRPRPVKDYRRHRVDTVQGTVCLRVPRYRCCRCSPSTQVWNPASELLSSRVTPELRHLQVSLGAQISYPKAADLLRMLLPPMGGTTHTTIRSRVIAVGERIDEEIRRDIAENRKPDKPAKHMVISIDGAFVKGRPPTDRASLEIITGRIEADADPSKVFAVVRDQDGRAKQDVQALLRKRGRDLETKLRVVSDGEDGMRSMVQR
jgi:transposase